MSKNVRNLMASAFDEERVIEPVKASAPLTQAKVTSNVKEAPRMERPPAPPPQKRVKSHTDIPTTVQMIARPDVSIDRYGIKPVATNFGCYNRDLWSWLKDFSSDNQFNGGVSITKSSLMEICLDVVMYDLGIEPIGYESHEQLREDIQRKIAERQ